MNKLSGSKKADTDTPWEMGSEFHWTARQKGPVYQWPAVKLWYALGRDAVISTVKLIQTFNVNTALWVPDYFCPEVLDSFQKAGFKLKTYSDNPIRKKPDWEILRPNPGDAVLAVNYFGLRSGDAWMRWHIEHQQVYLIEDHTHDPFSDWAMNSRADYAFASIRKIYPVSDGAILWSPKGREMPRAPSTKAWNGCAFKLAAMIMKKDYLRGNTQGPEFKEAFRHLQVEGEKQLAGQSDLQISPWSRILLDSGYPQAWRQQREKNIRMFCDMFPLDSAVNLLAATWPEGSCPFNVALVFLSEKERNFWRNTLIRQEVYPSIHWELSADAADDALNLSRCILNIPLDQRYRATDVLRVVEFFSTL